MLLTIVSDIPALYNCKFPCRLALRYKTRLTSNQIKNQHKVWKQKWTMPISTPKECQLIRISETSAMLLSLNDFA